MWGVHANCFNPSSETYGDAGRCGRGTVPGPVAAFGLCEKGDRMDISISWVPKVAMSIESGLYYGKKVVISIESGICYALKVAMSIESGIFFHPNC